MDEPINKTLKELYELDPSLKKHDTLLRSMLSEILAAKPNAQMDPLFYRDLRETLLSHLSETSAEKATSPRFSLFGRLGYAFAGLAVVTGVAVLANGISPHGGFGITPVGPNSFGSLKIATNGEKGGLGGGGDMADSLMIYPEERINYHFNYVGDEFSLGDTVDVLKRVSSKGGVNFDFNLDALNIDALGKLKVTYTNFEPTGDEGYSLSFDPTQQTLSLNEYHVSSEDCPWGFCNSWDTSSLTANEIPTEDALVSVSDAFLKKMGIRQSLLGEPYAYIPTGDDLGEINYTLTVTYPFEIEGLPVYNTWGGRAGMSVDIDVHRMKVTHVNWIYTSEEFASSAYPAATKDEVLAAAESGANGSAQWDDPTEVIELDLGTPRLVYSQVQIYGDSGTYSDLYAPAYAFPILNDDNDQYFGDSIVVPLAEELIQSSPPMILF